MHECVTVVIRDYLYLFLSHPDKAEACTSLLTNDNTARTEEIQNDRDTDTKRQTVVQSVCVVVCACVYCK